MPIKKSPVIPKRPTGKTATSQTKAAIKQDATLVATAKSGKKLVKGNTKAVVAKPRIYYIQCPLCYRIFQRRNKVDMRLRAHNDKSGKDCFGRVGHRYP